MSKQLTFKGKLKKITPVPIWNTIRDTRSALARLPELPGAYLHPWRRRSIEYLKSLKDIHRGKRCFIIGNGPSLRQTDLTRLRDEYTFGLNRIYLLFPELGFNTTYYVSVNDLVIEQCSDEIKALPLPKFISWRSHIFFQTDIAQNDTALTFLYTTYTGPKFAKDVTGRLWEGATVTYTTMQLAFHMGFEQVILIGVDHNFSTKGDPNKTITSNGDDPNHFDPSYFGKGFRWQLPDLETSEMAYQMARQTYEKAGRQIIDATLGGKLTVFPKVDYNSLF